MRKSSGRYEMDMCSGPLLKQVLVFALPLMFSGIMQLMYNAADIVVVGRFVGPTALAAVGSTGSLVNLTVNFFIGLSVGTSVVVARHYGANEYKDVNQTVHTSMLLSVLGGVVVGTFGVITAPTLLKWMGSPDDVIGQASLYLRIYFSGVPALMIYNFAAAILRAVGDTRRPLYYLLISGAINVALNLLFVIAFNMGVAGVGLATVISQCVSMTLILICMIRSHSAIHLNVRALRIYKDKLLKIVRVGLPAGLQSSIFSISNVLVQSSVNSFGSVVMAGNAASANIEGFTYTAMNSFYHAALSFSSQNVGARMWSRVRRVLLVCIGMVTAVGLIFSGIVYMVRWQLLGIYSTDPAVIQAGMRRLAIFCFTYFTCGIMDVMVGQMRGLGYSLVPMFVSLTGVCGVRIAWLFTFFAWNRTLDMLYMAYPLSWIATALVHICCYIVVSKRMRNVPDGQPLPPARARAR